MKRTLKSILCGILIVAAAAAFAGCGKDIKKDTKHSRTKDTKSVATGDNACDNADDNIVLYEPCTCILFNITNGDVFETGYYGMKVEYTMSSNGEVYFKKKTNDDLEWKVYVLDEELTDGYEALEDMEPALVNDGELELEEGQWIYVYCNCNSLTGGNPVNAEYEAWYWGP